MIGVVMAMPRICRRLQRACPPRMAKMRVNMRRYGCNNHFDLLRAGPGTC